MQLTLRPSRSLIAGHVRPVGFLAGYGGRTREAYGLDLQQFVAWCAECHLRLGDAKTAKPLEIT